MIKSKLAYQRLKRSTFTSYEVVKLYRRNYTDKSSLPKKVLYESSLHKQTGKAFNDGKLPKSADVVVIGGGVMGCSAFYHLSKMLKGKVVLLEKHKLTSGTTWHTAGLLGQLRFTDVDTELLRQTKNLMTDILPNETGLHTGWVQTGGLLVSVNKDRTKESEILHSLGNSYGIESFVLSPEESLKVHPLINVSDIHSTLYVPSDGTVDPAGTCLAYTRAGTKHGGKLYEGCSVEDIVLKDDYSKQKIAGVKTNLGYIETDVIVNCTGVFAPFIGKMAGVDVPQFTFKHSYIITEPINGISKTPCVRSPEGTVYIKRQGDALQVGGFESNPIPWEVERDFHFGLFDLEWHTIDDIIAAACNRIPAMETSGMTSTVSGPESFTIDHRAILGESPEVRGFYHCSGMNSLGMQFSGGFGDQMAQWIVKGKPELPMFNYDIRRFPHNLKEHKIWLKEKSHESFARHYSSKFPHDQPLAARNQKTDALYEILLNKGSFYEVRNSFERPSYFTNGKIDLSVKPYDYYGAYDEISKHEDYPYYDELRKEYSFDFSDEIHTLISKECLKCRTTAAIFNMSSYGKLKITGHDASKVVQYIFTKDVSSKNNIGKCSYVLMLNSGGGIEADLIVSTQQEKNGDLSYYLTVGASVPVYCKGFIEDVINRKRFNCKVDDLTDKVGILSVQGPNSLSLMSEIVDDQKKLQELKFSRFYDAVIAGLPVSISRLSFVGELGFEIHCDMNDLVAVYEAVDKIANKHEAIDAGFRAIHNLSNEIGFHHWHATIRSDDNPFEANLSRLCDLSYKSFNYIGKECLMKKKAEPLNKRLVTFTCDTQIPFYGQEVIWRNDERVGLTRSSDFSYCLNKNILHGYLTPSSNLLTLSDEDLIKGSYFIERMNRKYACELHLRNPFDQEMNRLRGKYDDTMQRTLIDQLKKIDSI